MSRRQAKSTIRTAAVALALACALILAACGSGRDSGTDPGNAADAPDYSRALASAPAKLKPLYAKGGVLVPGELDAFSAQLEQVRGYPAVVNNWASWCGPCRVEWPWFQEAAEKYLDRVAFIGVDGDDSDGAATTFLKEHPVPYPSFADPDKDLDDRTGATLIGAFPNTLFFDRDGKLVFAHQGQYSDQAALEADIRKYALQ